MQGTDVELYKRLRLVRKKLRQIDELLTEQSDGKELNEEQLVKVSTREDLHKELKTLTSIAEGIERQKAASEEPQEQEEPEGVAEGPGAMESGQEGAEGTNNLENPEPSAPQGSGPSAPTAPAVPQPVSPPNVPEPSEQSEIQPAQPEDSQPKKSKKKQSGDDGWTVVGNSSKITQPVPQPSSKKKAVEPSVPKPHEAPSPPQLPSKPPAREEVKDPKTKALDQLKKGWRNATFIQTFVEGHRTAVSCIKILGDKILSGGFDNTVKEWELSSGRPLKSFGGHTNCVRAVGGAGKLYYSAGEDSNLMVWEAKSGKSVRKIYCFAPIRCMDVSGGEIITGHSDCTVRIYEAGESGSENPKVTLKGHDSAVVTVKSYNTGANIVSSDRGGTVIIWDVKAKTIKQSFCHPQEEAARGVHWDQAKSMMITAHEADTVAVWEDPYEKPKLKWGGQGEVTEGLSCFSFDSILLLHMSTTATGSGAVKVYLWDTKEHLYTIAPEDTDAATCMDRVGDRTVVGGLDGWITILCAVDSAVGAERAQVIMPSKLAKGKKTAAGAQGGGTKNKSKQGREVMTAQLAQKSKSGMSTSQMIGSAIGLIGAVVFALVAAIVAFDRSTFATT